MKNSRMKNSLEISVNKKKTKFAQIFILLSVLAVMFSGNVFAQDDEEFPEYFPPPKIELSKDEKTALSDEKDVKSYTKLAIDLMNARLKKAEELTTNQKYNDVLQELGGFQAIMNSVMQFLWQNNTGRGKVLDNFKRYEMALRSFTPRLETIRREMPERHENYVIRLLKLIRENRAKAVEQLFGKTILPADEN